MIDSNSTLRRAAYAILLSSVVPLWAQAPGPAQPTPDLPAAPAPTAEAIAAYQRTLPAGVKVESSTGSPMPLTIDEAISRAVKQNLQVELSRQNERRVKGLQSTTINALLPTLQAQGYTNTQEINLAAMGFKPQALAPLLASFGIGAAGFATIVKVDVTSAQINASQQVFNVPAYFLYRAAQRAGAVAQLQTGNVRDGVALQAGSQYLKALADQALIQNAKAQVESDRVAFRQAADRQAAGVGVHLDTLRAEVQLRTQEQSLISAETGYEKDKIALNRLMGVAAGQELTLTDTVPYAELTAMPHDETLAFAYTRRSDLLGLEAQQQVAEKTERAVRYERLPTVAFGGYYGVLGETQGLYHGVFSAEGSLKFPIFKEAQFRGEHEVAQSQLIGLRHQVDGLRGNIDQQIRASMLDVDSSNELVKFARSNVQLARQELTDSEERFRAGVDDNLPVVQAQATLADAENRLVQATFQFNSAKLQLARNVGVIQTDYKSYLGR